MPTTAPSETPPKRSRTRRRIKGLVALPLVVTLLAGVAWAYWNAGSVPGGNGASAATTVNAGATPTAVFGGAGNITVSWAASTTTGGTAVSGYVITRYDAATLTAQTILTACAGTVTALTCTEASVPDGQWRYSVTPALGTYWRGAESALSTVVTADSTAPTNVISLSAVSGNAVLVGNTIYYRGTAAGSFTLSSAVSDAGSGPASSATPALTGTATGWTHTGSTVSTPAGGPYVSTVFSWAAATTSGPTEVVTGQDLAGNTTATTLTLVNDSTGPTGNSLSVPDGYQAARSITVTFTTGTDGSGIATRQLQRASATLTAGACGTFGSFANIGSAYPTSPYVDAAVSLGSCYKYQYVVTDKLTNATTTTSASVAKLDYAGAVSGTAGLLGQWRLGESLTALLSSDMFIGTVGTLLTSHVGELGATWANQAGASTSNSEKLTGEGRAYRSGTGHTVDYTSVTPASADYSVAADLYYKGLLASDSAGVVGRLNTATSAFYSATWAADDTWKISKGLTSVLATTAVQPDLVVAETYNVRLAISGSAPVTLKLYVNDALVLTTTDATSPITAAGRGGIIAGSGTAVAAGTTTGIHLDNFQLVPSTYPRAIDGTGSNTGDYFNGPTQGVTGAIAGDTNTATLFNGLNEYVQVPNPTGFPVGSAARSVELWFKTTSTKQQVLYDYGTQANNQEFGLWLGASGSSITAWQFGTGNDKDFTLPYSVNDGAWHQVVETYGSGAITLYVDGALVSSAAATLSTVMDGYGFQIGAIVNSGDGNSGGFFEGALDEVSLYTTALTASTVANHYGLADGLGPTGGSIDAIGLVGTGSRYSTTTTLSLNLDKGGDPSGVAATGATVERAVATLTSTGGGDGVCGAFSPYTLVTGGTDPTSPMTDTVTDQACFSYQYSVSDTAGNGTTYTSPNIKVDSTPPGAPGLVLSAFNNTFFTGTAAYYRPGAASGSVTITATSADSASGVASYTFPPFGSGWTSTPGGLGVNTYSWAAVNPPVPGSVSITGTNHAGSTSGATTGQLTPDSTAPTTGTVSYVDGTINSPTVSVSFTTGTDAGSGVGTRLLQRSSAMLTGSTCGTFGAFTTVVNGTNPTSPLTNAVSPATCYKYQYVVSDNVGNQGTAAVSASIVKVSATYFNTVMGTSGLVDYWRLGEDTTSHDSFTGTTGAELSTHTSDSGATWTRGVNDLPVTLTGVLTNEGRLRKSNVTGGVSYTNSAVPASPDYLVEADLFVKSIASPDDIGVQGRIDLSDTSSVGTNYLVRYNTAAATWQLRKNVAAVGTVLASFPQVLTPGTSYRMGLDMNGKTIRMIIDGVVRATVTDASITAAGRTGIRMGASGDSAPQSDTQGMHVDNFTVTPPLADTFGALKGDYFDGPLLGLAGAIAYDADSAVQFDGAKDFASVASPVANDFSAEFWFKSTQGIGTGTTWQSGAGMVDANITGTNNDWGTALRSDGKVVAGIGGGAPGDISVVSTSGGYNDGLWHQVVFTRIKASGVMQLYVDGVASGSATGSILTLTSPTINFGRLASGANYLAGGIDDVSIYNSALSQATVTGHYLSGH